MEAATPIRLSEIEDTLANKGWRGQFPQAIEALYRSDIGKVRARAVQRALVPSLIIYNLLLLTDISLLPDTARLATALHFPVVTPALLLLYYLYHRARGFLTRQTLEAAIPILICSQTLTILSLNDNPNTAHYQYFVPLIVLFSNVNQRLDTRVATAATALMLLMYLAVLYPHSMPLEFKLSGYAFALVASYLALVANIRFQRDARYGYLMRLREQVRLQAAEMEAMHDPLTGLANRRYLGSFAEGLAAADDRALSVILMDIDFFKPFNDLHGHARGDECLKSVAKAVEAVARSHAGFAVRYGGEEFLIVLPDLDAEAARTCAEAVRVEVERLRIPHGRSSASELVTISLGVATGAPSEPSFEPLIAAADAALYGAKANGRNRVAAARPDLCRDGARERRRSDASKPASF